MKNLNKTTNYLLVLFLLAQIIGLYTVFNYIDLTSSIQEGHIISKNNPVGQNADLETNIAGIVIIGSIILGTLLLFLIIYFKLYWVWRLWFYIAIVFCLSIAYGSFVSDYSNPIYSIYIPIGLALITGFFKIYKPNFWIHNITELFLYGGLIQFFIGSVTLWNAVLILIVISLYDIYAVWHSKHMIALANNQTESKLFAGIIVPNDVNQKDLYKQFNINNESKKESKKKIEENNETKVSRTSILGGGDIAFVLLFTAVVLMEKLTEIIATRNLGATLIPFEILTKMAFLKILIIPVCAALALYFLFAYGKSDKFYPAMPFLTIGCFIGYFLFRLVI